MVKPYEPLYLVKDAAAVLGINMNQLYELINSGKLPALKLGRLKIRGSDLERFIEKHPVVQKEKKEFESKNLKENEVN